MGCFAAVTALAGSVLGVTALAVMSLCSLEGWKSDPLVTVMLFLSFLFLFASCHTLDRADARQRGSRGPH